MHDKNKITDSMKHRTKKCFKPEFAKSVKNIHLYQTCKRLLEIPNRIFLTSNLNHRNEKLLSEGTKGISSSKSEAFLYRYHLTKHQFSRI